MTKNESIVKALLLPINPALVVLLGIFTIVWGFWLANPWWEVFMSAPLFSEMALMAPEWVWGLVAMVAGVVVCFGAIKRSYRALTTGSMVAFFHWLIIGIMFFWGDWTNTGGITASTIALYAAVVYLNIKVNFKDHRNDIGKID